MPRAARLTARTLIALSLVAIPLVALPLSAALAAGPGTITLTQSSPPATYRIPGRNLDVLGITPGMPPDAVRDKLRAQYGTVYVNQEDMGLDNRGLMVATQVFTTKMTARKDADETSVVFATPTTGNGVVEVTRQISFPNEADAPPLQQLRAELLAHYGTPAFDGPAVGTGEVQLLAWSFAGGKPTACPRSSCRADLSEGLNVRNMPAYQRAMKTGHELTIVATLLAGISDPTRAAGLVVTMSDAATKYKTLEAAISQLKTATTTKK